MFFKLYTITSSYEISAISYLGEAFKQAALTHVTLSG